MNARDYDREIGQFLSPDTIVPDPSNLFDYNRYMYVRSNPMKYTDPTGHCGVAAVAGPPGLVFDLPCWGSSAGAAATAAVGTAVAVGPAADLAVNYVLNEEPLPIPPLYPGLAPDAPNSTLLVTVPVPGSTTLTSGIPLLQQDGTILTGSTPTVPSQQVLADPLPVQQSGSNLVFNKTLQTGGHTLNNQTLKGLGLTKEQGKRAVEALKEDLSLPSNFHPKIMSNGDYVDAHTGEVLGNLYDYVD